MVGVAQKPGKPTGYRAVPLLPVQPTPIWAPGGVSCRSQEGRVERGGGHSRASWIRSRRCIRTSLDVRRERRTSDRWVLSGTVFILSFVRVSALCFPSPHDAGLGNLAEVCEHPFRVHTPSSLWPVLFHHVVLSTRLRQVTGTKGPRTEGTPPQKRHGYSGTSGLVPTSAELEPQPPAKVQTSSFVL